jgi:hypothetical protein
MSLHKSLCGETAAAVRVVAAAVRVVPGALRFDGLRFAIPRANALRAPGRAADFSLAMQVYAMVLVNVPIETYLRGPLFQMYR